MNLKKKGINKDVMEEAVIPWAAWGTSIFFLFGLFFVGAYFFWSGVETTANDFRVQLWEKCSAEVVSSNFREGGCKFGIGRFYLRYRYQVDEVFYEGTAYEYLSLEEHPIFMEKDRLFFENNYPKGEIITCFVNLENPKEALIVLPVLGQPLCLLLGGTLILISFSLLQSLFPALESVLRKEDKESVFGKCFRYFFRWVLWGVSALLLTASGIFIYFNEDITTGAVLLIVLSFLSFVWGYYLGVFYASNPLNLLFSNSHEIECLKRDKFGFVKLIPDYLLTPRRLFIASNRFFRMGKVLFGESMAASILIGIPLRVLFYFVMIICTVPINLILCLGMILIGLFRKKINVWLKEDESRYVVKWEINDIHRIEEMRFRLEILRPLYKHSFGLFSSTLKNYSKIKLLSERNTLVFTGRQFMEKIQESEVYIESTKWNFHKGNMELFISEELVADYFSELLGENGSSLLMLHLEVQIDSDKIISRYFPIQ